VPGDPTPPVVTLQVFGAVGDNGWYTSNVMLNWTYFDPESGVTSTTGCDAASFSGDTPGISRTCIAVSDGGTTAVTKTVKLDKTPPTAGGTRSRGADSNGWYNHPVAVSFSGADAMSGLASCSSATYSGPDNSAAVVGGTCRDKAGNVATASVSLKYDATPPSTASALSRSVDANGWYNHPILVSFDGADAMSGLDSCSSATYGGPDNSAAMVGGTCRDNAGNVATASVSLKYDATPPSVTWVRTKPWNRSASISWQVSPDTRLVEVFRAPGVKGAPSSVVYRGTASRFRDTGLVAARKYTYMVTGIDEAANRAGKTVQHIGTHALLTPAPGERVSAPPRLTWTRVKRARYYNVQLVLRGRRVFSAWPTARSLQLPRTWVEDGRRHRLRPGLYRWYVWPGFGPLAASRYGARLGGSTFVVRP
jgi:hypothetical protein